MRGVLLASVLVGGVQAQTLNTDEQVRRERERLEQRRELLEPGPRVQLQSGAAPTGRRLVAEEPCFRIARVAVRGWEGLGLPQRWLTATLAGPSGDDAPEGRCIGAQGTELLISRLQDALVGRGLVTTRVVAPTQTLSSGELSLTILPGRIRRVVGPAPTAGVLPPLRPGEVLNVRDIEQALETMQRVPTAQAEVRIEPAVGPAPEPGWSDVVISWRQTKRWRATLTLDDSGTRETGRLQASATVSMDNPLGFNDLLYGTYASSAGWADPGGRGNRSQILHYSFPAGLWLFAAAASRSRYFQSVAGATQTYMYSGSSGNAEVRASRLLHRDARSRTTAYLRAFARSSSNFIDDTEIEIQRRRVGGWELGLSYRRTAGAASGEASLLYRRGTGAFGSLAAPEESFREGTSRFVLVAADASAALPWTLGDRTGQVTAHWRAQWNRTPLTPQDRFAIGGRFTVRGFDGEQVLLAERGWLVRSEISAQLGDTPTSGFAALDHGEVGGRSAQLLAGRRLTGAAVGLRGAVSSAQWEIFAGKPIRRPASFRTASSTAGFGLVWSY